MCLSYHKNGGGSIVNNKLGREFNLYLRNKE